MRTSAVAWVAMGAALGMLVGVGAAAAPVPQAGSAPTDDTAHACVAVYGKQPATCMRVVCDAKYRTFIGTWSGKFHAYVREQSQPGRETFRPYDESVTYRPDDCLRNSTNGDVFIVGHETDSYAAFGKLPAKIERSLLVTGKHADGTPFLRTVRDEGTYDYRLAFQDAAANLSIWQLRLPAANGQPPMTFTVIDGRDFNAQSDDRRNVTITMQVGPEQTPYWKGVIEYGWHARNG